MNDTLKAITLAAAVTFIVSFVLVKDFHLMLSPSGWGALNQKVDDQKAMRHWSMQLVITPLSQHELSKLCDCDISLVPEFIAKGALISAPMQMYDLEITLSLHEKNICGLVNASPVNTAHRGVNYKWHGLPFTSSDCDRVRAQLVLPEK